MKKILILLAVSVIFASCATNQEARTCPMWQTQNNVNTGWKR